MSQNVQDDNHYERLLPIPPSLPPLLVSLAFMCLGNVRFLARQFRATTRVFNKQLGELATWLEFPVTKTGIYARFKPQQSVQ